jgi:hypothetical protein
MSNAFVLEFLEIIQRGLAEGSLAVADFGIFVFENNCFRFVERANKRVSISCLSFFQMHRVHDVIYLLL